MLCSTPCLYSHACIWRILNSGRTLIVYTVHPLSCHAADCCLSKQTLLQTLQIFTIRSSTVGTADLVQPGTTRRNPYFLLAWYYKPQAITSLSGRRDGRRQFKFKNVSETGRQTGGESQLPADLGSFGAQQIRGDYLSLIRCKEDSRFIDSCTACHSPGFQSKFKHQGGKKGKHKKLNYNGNKPCLVI